MLECVPISHVEPERVTGSDGKAGYVLTDYIGSWKAETFAQDPQAFRVRQPPEGETPPHFHEVDQFQVVFDGTGRIGHRAVSAGTVHYVDRYTPYGPVAAGREGLSYFTLRRSTGQRAALWMPESRDRKILRPGSHFTCDVDMRRLRGPREASVELLAEVSHGAKTYGIYLGPRASLPVLPSAGLRSGGYLVILRGSVAAGPTLLSAGSLAAFDEASDVVDLAARDQGAAVACVAYRPRPDPLPVPPAS